VVAVPRGAVMSVTGDPEDDLVLATARLGNAEYLVTRDHGLLRLQQHDETMIVAPHDFLRLLPR
jgi:predicted nucleic acid-binding protein